MKTRLPIASIEGDPAEAPRVSIVIPAYRRPDVVARAVASALSQEGVALEVILVVDGCPETVAAAAKIEADPRLRVIRNAVNQGVARARNSGLRVARGELVAHLDVDDCLLPGALARAVAAFDRPELGARGTLARRHVGLVYGDVELEDGAGKALGTRREPDFPGRRAFLRSPFDTPFILYRRAALTDVDEGAIRCWNAGVVAAVSERLAVQRVEGGPLVAHRVDGRNTSLAYQPESCAACASSTTCRLSSARRDDAAADGYPLSKLVLVLTTRCNLDCGYCFTRRYKWDIAIEDAIRFLVQARDRGATQVSLTGGEPSLYDHFDDVVHAAVDLGMGVSAISNGWDWTDDRLERFVGAPGTSLCLSLEGRDPELHDTIRGRGSHATLLSFLQRVREKAPPGYPIAGIVVATRENIDRLDDLAAWALDDLRLSSLRIDRVVPSGNAEQLEEFSPADTQRFRDASRRVVDRFGARVQALATSFDEGGCPLYLGIEGGFHELSVFPDATVPACTYLHMDRATRIGPASWGVDRLLSRRNIARVKALLDEPFADRARQVARKGLFTCVECMERRNALEFAGRWPPRRLPVLPATAIDPIEPSGRPYSAAERSGLAPRPVIFG